MPIPLPPPQPRRQKVVADTHSVIAQMRQELIGFLHMGHVRQGERLPSIRALAHARNVDHRVVAAAYKALEQEGLVQIRGRSGVVAAGRPTRDPQDGFGPAAWAASVLHQAWTQKLDSRDLGTFVSRCIQTSDLKCVCVESNSDQMLAYTTDIEGISGITAIPVYVSPESTHLLQGSDDIARVTNACDDADLVITTQYHAIAVRRALTGRDVPIVVIQIDSALIELVSEHVRNWGLTMVCVTEEFGRRMRLMYGHYATDPSAMQVVLAKDAEAVQLLKGDKPVLLTRAAREQLGEEPKVPLVFPHSPTIGVETLKELAEQVVRINLAAAVV